jgi:hypothetical protein
MVDLRLVYQSSETFILSSHRENIRMHKITKKKSFGDFCYNKLYVYLGCAVQVKASVGHVATR